MGVVQGGSRPGIREHCDSRTLEGTIVLMVGDMDGGVENLLTKVLKSGGCLVVASRAINIYWEIEGGMVRDILASETDLEENLFGVRICMDAESRR